MSINYKLYDKHIKTTERKEDYYFSNVVKESSFNTLSDLLSSFREYLAKNEEHKSSSYAINYDRTGWFTGGSFDGALNVDNSNLDNNIADFSKIAENVKESLHDSFCNPEYFNDVEGLCFDVGDVLAGRPECWFNIQDKKQKKLDIIINMATSSIKSKEQIFNKGVCILGMIDALKDSDVLINASFTIQGKNYDKRKHTTYCYNLNINIDLDIISPDTFRFMLCNPMMVRRLYIFLVELMTHKNDLSNHGYYGTSDYIPEKAKIENDTLVFTSDFTPFTLEEGIKTIKEKLSNIMNNDGENILLTI